MIDKAYRVCFITAMLCCSACNRSRVNPVDYELISSLIPIEIRFGEMRQIENPWTIPSGENRFFLKYKGDDRAFDYSNHTSIRLAVLNEKGESSDLLRVDTQTEMKEVPGGYRFVINVPILIAPELRGRLLIIEVLGPNELSIFRKRFFVQS